MVTPEGHKGHRKAAKGGRALGGTGTITTLRSTWTALYFYLGFKHLLAVFCDRAHVGYLTLSLKFFIIKWDITAPTSQDGSVDTIEPCLKIT